MNAENIEPVALTKANCLKRKSNMDDIEKLRNVKTSKTNDSFLNKSSNTPILKRNEIVFVKRDDNNYYPAMTKLCSDKYCTVQLFDDHTDKLMVKILN